MKIDWRQELDDNDNTVWEGDSPYHDAGKPFVWRLRQRLEGNCIIWYADHDAELGGKGDTWPSIGKASADCQAAHNAILAEYQSEEPDE